MKSLLSLFIVFIAFSVHAQNYDCFTPASKQYFINANGYLRAMRIDSVRAAGADRIYFPYHSLRGNYLSGSPVFDTAGGSWLGKRIIAHVDGSYVFDNMWGDSIVIKAHAAKGDTWLFFKDTAATANYYMASVTAVDTMTVLGHPDSVKYISLTAYNDSILVADSFNDMQIILSKHYGFVQAFDLFSFPYHNPAANTIFDDSTDYYLQMVNNNNGVMFGTYVPQNQIFKTTGFYIPRNNEMNKYSVGDMYRYIVDYDLLMESDELIDSITDRATIGGSIVYTIHEFRKMNHFTSSGGYPTISYTSSTFGASGDTLPVFYMPKMPEEWKVGFVYNYQPLDTTHCVLSALYGIEDDDIKVYGTAININLEMPCGDGLKYKLGLGEVSNSHCNTWGSYDTKLLVCYVRSGKACYVCPDLLSVPEMKAAAGEIVISPNPASDVLTIELPADSKTYNISIFNIAGEQVYETNAKDKLLISVASLQNGFYVARIFNDSAGPVIKKIIVRH